MVVGGSRGNLKISGNLQVDGTLSVTGTNNLPRPIRLSSPATIAALDCSGGAAVINGICAVPKGVEWKIPWTKKDVVLAKSSTVTMQMQVPIYTYNGNVAGCVRRIVNGGIWYRG